MTQVNRAAGNATVLVPTGMLGAGVRREHIRYGIAAGAHAIAADSGPENRLSLQRAERG
jgi:hypothetical protein